jgi:hypothetical protein
MKNAKHDGFGVVWSARTSKRRPKDIFVCKECILKSHAKKKD